MPSHSASLFFSARIPWHSTACWQRHGFIVSIGNSGNKPKTTPILGGIYQFFPLSAEYRRVFRNHYVTIYPTEDFGFVIYFCPFLNKISSYGHFCGFALSYRSCEFAIPKHGSSSHLLLWKPWRRWNVLCHHFLIIPMSLPIPQSLLLHVLGKSLGEVYSGLVG